MYLKFIFLFIFLKEGHCQVYNRFTGEKVVGTPTFINGTADIPGVCTMSIPPCDPKDFRSQDGTCNNLKRPIRGTRIQPFARILPPAYSNGGNARVRKDGSPLPLARRVRTTILQDGRVSSSEITALGFHSIEYFFAEILMTNGFPDYVLVRRTCCTPAGAADPRCFPIIVPEDDPYLGNTDVRCMNFSRAQTFQDMGCVPLTLHPEQVNFQTAHMDLQLIYGTQKTVNSLIRTNQDGLMRTEIRKGREMPPLANVADRLLCPGNLANETDCYLFGDPGSNFDTRFIIINIYFLKEHNRIARALKKLNPCWDDDKLYNISRKINIAISQNLLYYEVLPTLYGRENMIKYNVIQDKVRFVNEYDPYLDPLTYIETTIYLRFFHNLIEGRVKLYDKTYREFNQFFQSNTFFRPAVVEDDFNFEAIGRGAVFQMGADNDNNVDPDTARYVIRFVDTSRVVFARRPLSEESPSYLYEYIPMSETFFSTFFRAFDLIAADIQRSRDLGIRPYNDYREYCGLPRAKKFDDFADVMDYDRIDELRNVYKDVEDVDLIAGLYTERVLKGTQSGPTLLCLTVRQYLDGRRADRYWFERGDHYQSFTKGQLYQVRKSSFARLVCDHSNAVKDVQPNALRTPSEENKVVPCAHIPKMDLTEWADPTCYEEHHHRDYKPDFKDSNQTSINKKIFI